MSTDMPGTDGQERFRSEISLADAALMLDISEAQVRELAAQKRLRHRHSAGTLIIDTDHLREYSRESGVPRR